MTPNKPIRITPEMIEAGADVLLAEFGGGVIFPWLPDVVAVEVFSAMIRVSPSPRQLLKKRLDVVERDAEKMFRLAAEKLHINRSCTEAIMRGIFDLFNNDPSSPLFGLMSPIERKRNKISRVTFNAALKPIFQTFSDSEPQYIYEVLASYLHSCLAGLRQHRAQDKITNPTLFRALMLLFPVVAERVSDRHDLEFSTSNFSEFIGPMFSRLKKSDVSRLGTSYIALYELLRKAMRSGFSIKKA